jgi:hypothetical protein
LRDIVVAPGVAMPTKAYFEHLARMSLLFARVETNSALVARFTELAAEYEEKARQTPDDGSMVDVAPPFAPSGEGDWERPY